jgi:glycosyltransferase involved in cell wall biosynthesis
MDKVKLSRGAKMDNNPRVTVLMPVYNGEKYLREAIDSILNQTFTDFELLIINDGSTDESQKIIESYNDKRIRLVNNETNLKLIETLNKGLKLAKGEYIARMDCDDIAMPDRFKTQVDYMDSHKDVGVCGSYIKTFITGNKPRTRKLYTDSNEIRCTYLFWGCMAHPSVMLKKKLFSDNNLEYSKDFIHAEDYELWSRCLKLFNITNLPVPLLMYRVHKNSIGNANSGQQIESTVKSMLIYLKNFGIDFTEDEFEIHKLVSFYKTLEYKDRDDLKKAERWLNRLLIYNSQAEVLNQRAFLKIIADNWYLLCLSNSELGTYTVKCFLKSKFYGMDKKYKRLLTIKYMFKITARFIKRFLAKIIRFLKLKEVLRRIK